MTEEIWRPIEFEHYEVSNFGNVRSLRFNKIRSLTQQQSSNGYNYVNFMIDGKTRFRLVHRLVAWAFFGPSTLEVNHLNGIKTDNRIGNLEYCTRIANKRHAMSIGLSKGHTHKRMIWPSMYIVTTDDILAA
jgi:hypothetical protein